MVTTNQSLELNLDSFTSLKEAIKYYNHMINKEKMTIRNKSIAKGILLGLKASYNESFEAKLCTHRYSKYVYIPKDIIEALDLNNKSHVTIEVLN